MCRLRIGWVGFLVGLPVRLCLFRLVLAPIGQPNNSSTSTHKGAEPSSAQVSHDSHSPIHPPTHTLTLSHTHPKHNHLCVHSLTHLLAHSLIPFTLPVTHSLTNSSHSHSHVQAVVRRTTASLRHMLLAGTCPLCHPQSSAPRRAWQDKRAGSPLSKWSFNDHRFPAK